jgi:Protein of unknown function (DUF4239)
MNLWSAGLVIVGATTFAVIAMLLVRRRAPEGSSFNDGDRAAGVFGVLATGFSVLLGFIVVLAFTSYDNARSGADSEALTVAQQVETAQFLPDDDAAKLTGELVCYARSVVHQEWPDLEDSGTTDHINPWAIELFRTIRTVEPAKASEEAAYGKWLDQTSDREDSRSDRIDGADGVIPLPLWLMLFFTTAVIGVFMLFFADSAESRLVQATLMGSVVSVIVGMLLLLSFLENPFTTAPGGLRPDSMERTLDLMQQELAVIGEVDIPCDVIGLPT